MKLLSAQQIREWDQYTIQSQGISSLKLMERASTIAARWIMDQYDTSVPFLVLCGCGNNGGDGLAITRILNDQGYLAKAFLVLYKEDLSPDCQANLITLKDRFPDSIELIREGSFLSYVAEDVVVIDALLGTGTNRAVSGWLSSFIQHVSSWKNKKIAIDMPSGLSADISPAVHDAVMMADHTLSFQNLKRTLFHPEGGRFAGNVQVLDISLENSFTETIESKYHVVDDQLIKSIHKIRKAFTHKGELGTAFLVGGSYGMMGAILLSARAAGRTGSGKVRVLAPECGYTIIQSCSPETMCMSSGEKAIEEILSQSKDVTAIGIGPGLGTDKKTMIALRNLLFEYDKPMVLDADALNIISKNPELLDKIPPQSILTPHPKEFERLFGKTENSMARIEKARMEAIKRQLFFVMKDHYTVIVTPEGLCWYNIRGSEALATAGSGDVLTGIITGLMAQGYTSFEAAVLGVHLHAVAGELAAKERSAESVIAGDIIDHISSAYRAIRS